jgi:capsular exopolysaccharide synthesis family protein
MQSPSSPIEDAVDLRDYVAVLKRRAWLIVSVVILFVGAAAAYSFTRVPVYTAQSEVLVLPASSTTQFRPDQLVSLDTEARLVRSAPVAQMALESLGWPVDIAYLLKRTSVETTPDTLVLDISYTSREPGRAAAGADAFANAYLAYKQQRAEAADLAVRQGIQDQIDRLQKQRAQLDQLIGELPPGSAELQDAQEERDTVSGQIAVFSSQLASVPPVADPGEVILPASPPLAPSSPKHPLNLALGVFLGVFVGVVLAFIRDRLDDRISSRADLELALEAPVLASIPRVAGWKKSGSPVLVTDQQPRSPAAEAYRTLRTAILAMGRQRDLRVIAVVSPAPAEGKSATTANLAVTLAQTDKRVLAISADLRQPNLHRFFRRTNEVGLADVLHGEAPLEEVTQMVSANLWLISSGRPSVRPAELLQSHAMSELIRRERDHFDFVVIDCPPVLGLADTLAIAPFVDGVVLVARAERSKRGAALHAVDQLQQVGANLVGGVLNDVTLSRGASYGYGYGYGYARLERAENEGERSSVDPLAPRSPRPEEPVGAPGNGRRAEPQPEPSVERSEGEDRLRPLDEPAPEARLKT